MLNSVLFEVNEFLTGRLGLDEFQLWFERSCHGSMFDAPPRVLRLCMDIEQSLKSYQTHQSMDALKQALATAIRPFVRAARDDDE